MDEDFQKLLMDEVKGMRDDISQVRTKDIPDLKTSIAILKHDSSLSSKVYSTVGGFVAFVAAYVAMKFDHRG